MDIGHKLKSLLGKGAPKGSAVSPAPGDSKKGSPHSDVAAVRPGVRIATRGVADDAPGIATRSAEVASHAEFLNPAASGSSREESPPSGDQTAFHYARDDRSDRKAGPGPGPGPDTAAPVAADFAAARSAASVDLHARGRIGALGLAVAATLQEEFGSSPAARRALGEALGSLAEMPAEEALLSQKKFVVPGKAGAGDRSIRMITLAGYFDAAWTELGLKNTMDAFLAIQEFRDARTTTAARTICRRFGKVDGMASILEKLPRSGYVSPDLFAAIETRCRRAVQPLLRELAVQAMEGMAGRLSSGSRGTPRPTDAGLAASGGGAKAPPRSDEAQTLKAAFALRMREATGDRPLSPTERRALVRMLARLQPSEFARVLEGSVGTGSVDLAPLRDHFGELLLPTAALADHWKMSLLLAAFRENPTADTARLMHESFKGHPAVQARRESVGLQSIDASGRLDPERFAPVEAAVDAALTESYQTFVAAVAVALLPKKEVGEALNPGR